MKRLGHYGRIAGILTASVVAAAVIAHVHRNVYSLGITGGSTMVGGGWYISSSPNYPTYYLGITQIEKAHDGNGNAVAFSQAAKITTYAQIQLGSRALDVQAPFWLVTGVLGLLVLGFIGVAIATARWICEADGDKVVVGEKPS